MSAGITPHDGDSTSARRDPGLSGPRSAGPLRDSRLTVRRCTERLDIDDPSSERAAQDGVAWRDLAETEIALPRGYYDCLASCPG